MNRSNLSSPQTIKNNCNLEDLLFWVDEEINELSTEAIKPVIRHIVDDLDAFVKWPKKAILFWEGNIRTKGYHSYPSNLKISAKSENVYLDSRTNGPAVSAFCIAGGERPKRYGSNNQWCVHHLYSGKFPYLGKQDTLHAKKGGLHFTQSAGLIAVHPLADALCDEYPFFSWFLRAKAFIVFGYDPDQVFCNSIDKYGFGNGQTTFVYTILPK